MDRIARDWSRSKEREQKVWECRAPADWTDPFLRKLGASKQAGFARNLEMLREFRPDMLLAFPGGPGTADCVAKAHALGIEVKLLLEGVE